MANSFTSKLLQTIFCAHPGAESHQVHRQGVPQKLSHPSVAMFMTPFPAVFLCQTMVSVPQAHLRKGPQVASLGESQGATKGFYVEVRSP